MLVQATVECAPSVSVRDHQVIAGDASIHALTKCRVISDGHEGMAKLLR
jgi:hypothetical protein